MEKVNDGFVTSVQSATSVKSKFSSFRSLFLSGAVI